MYRCYSGIYSGTNCFAQQEVKQEDNTDKVETVDIIGSPVIRLGATQGRKGLKLPRINMGFSPENHKAVEKIRMAALARGYTKDSFPLI